MAVFGGFTLTGIELEILVQDSNQLSHTHWFLILAI
jgi:hypothetical protein